MAVSVGLPDGHRLAGRADDGRSFLGRVLPDEGHAVLQPVSDQTARAGDMGRLVSV